MTHVSHPNLLFVFGDQWRGQAVGYRGDPNACTPAIDRFACESIDWVNAVAGTPVCSPYRGSLMTGQHPLTHGVYINDVGIISDAVPFAECLSGAGYDTAYIGKWHVDGHGRQAFVPPERRLGFTFWRGFECTHHYHASDYYADTPEKLRWNGYDAEAQTRMACDYIRERGTADRPFALFLSWGPPHAPYETAPEPFRERHAAEKVRLRPNVPESVAAQAREQLAGYYAHVEALDSCFGRLLSTLEEAGVDEDTIVVFTSDHGDMLGSHGAWKKQRPLEESVRVPFLLRYPKRYGRRPRQLDACLNTPDIMPTLLSLCDVPIPDTVQGRNAAPLLDGEDVPGMDAALLALHFPFHQWNPARGGREYRGLRTSRYTYCRGLEGPWLLYDNWDDPYQLSNIVGDAGLAAVVEALDKRLQQELDAIGDEFLPGSVYLERDPRGIALKDNGDIPIHPAHGPYTYPMAEP